MIWGDRLGAADRALSDMETLLRRGQLRDLPAAMATMERAIQGLRNAGLDKVSASRLTDLRARAARVGDLVRAVMEGMRDARSSLATPTGFSSYDAAGRSDHIGQSRIRFEHRR